MGQEMDISQILQAPAIVSVVVGMAYFGFNYLKEKDRNHKEVTEKFIEKMNGDAHTSDKLNEIGGTINHIQASILQINDQLTQRMSRIEEDVVEVKMDVIRNRPANT